MWMRMLAITGALLAAAPVMSQTDPGLRDTVRVDSAIAFTTGQGVLPVLFINDEQLAGIEVTLQWDSPLLSVDSFSFSGSRVSYTNLKGSVIDDSTVTIYSFPFTGQPLISAGTGLLGRLFFSYPSDIGAALVGVDSIGLSQGLRDYGTTFSTASGIAFGPAFRAGFLDILDTVCCVGNRGNADGSADDEANVADLSYLVTYLFLGGPPPICNEEGNADGSLDEEVNVADLSFMVTFLFLNGPAPGPCP